MHWTEIAGDLIVEFDGQPENPAERRVVAIRSMTPLAKRQRAARIPTAYLNANLATWNGRQANPGALEIVQAFLASPDKSLYLHGAVGVGKTWVACTIANELLQQGKGVRFQTMSALLLELRHTFASEHESELSVLFPLFDVGFLVLDDLGDIALEQDRRASQFGSSRLLQLIERRWQEGKATIMTSNLSLAELVEWCGDERIGSRIRGLCGDENIVELIGRDLRFDEQTTLASVPKGQEVPARRS